MAIIKCPECGTEVSDKAEKCPKCACPIAGKSGKIQTVELTAKKFKKQQLIAAPIAIVGCIIMVFSALNYLSIGTWLGGLLLAVGLIWTIIVEIKIWWHHR